MTSTTELTDSQIKALPSTPITVIAAPGAGKGIIPISVMLSISPWIADYTNIDGACQLLLSDAPDNVEILSRLKETVGNGISNLLAWGEASIATINQQALVSGGNLSGNSGWNLADLENQSLAIQATNGGSGDFTGGNAGNKLKVTVTYIIIDIP